MPATRKAPKTDSELDSSGRESDAKSSLEPGLTHAHSKARYPDFLTGGAYLVTNDIVEKIYNRTLATTLTDIVTPHCWDFYPIRGL